MSANTSSASPLARLRPQEEESDKTTLDNSNDSNQTPLLKNTRRSSAADLAALHEHDLPTLVAENLELRKLVDALKFFDDPDIMSSREKAIVKHTFEAIADQANGLRVSELKMLNDRLGTNFQDRDIAKIQSELELSDDDFITVDQFLKWYADPTNLYVRRVKSNDRFDLERGSVVADHEFDLHKVHAHDINVPGTFEYRVAFSYNHQPISPWHDIPLFPHKAPADEVHFVCEIPKYTRAKFEIATDEHLNRIKQDVAHGVLRDYKHGDMFCNYGALPQTWEDPEHFSEETQAKGDNDPLDAVEMGLIPMKTGEVKRVRVLGVLALIDNGETDWKIITISVDDLLADRIHTLDELECVLPGAVGALREWLRNYKVCTGKPENQFGFDGSCMPKDFAMKVVHETHQMWERMIMTRSTV